MTFSRSDRLLVIAPHPDDEVLGCGGLIKKIKDVGGKVYILYLTIGETTEYSSYGVTSSKQRETEIKSVTKFFAVDKFKVAFPGNENHLRLDSLSQLDLISTIERGKDVSLDAIKPTIIAFPKGTDYNQDHRAAHMAVISACRPAPDTFKSSPNMILGYEFTGTTEWGVGTNERNNIFVPLSPNELKTKRKAMELYESQVREAAHTRSLENIESLARIRGAMAGSDYAEAYHGYRIVI